MLEVFARTRGRRSYDVAVNLHNLAAVRVERGAPAQAGRLYRRALALKTRLLGARHPDVGLTLFNLASLERDLGRAAAARAGFRRAHAIFRRALGARHPNTVAAAEQLSGR